MAKKSLELTNAELLNRIRAQTDMIIDLQKQVQSLNSELEQVHERLELVNQIVVSVGAKTAGAMTNSNAAIKQNDVTQKLLIQLTDEIKDLKEDGTQQEKEIEHIKLEVDNAIADTKARISLLQNYVNEQMRKVTSGGVININPPSGGWYTSRGNWTVDYQDGNKYMVIDDDEHGHIAMCENADDS